MERKISFSVGEYYHIYNRGVDKRDIYMDPNDKDRFIKLLFLSNGDKPYVFRLVQGQPLYKIDVGEKRVAVGCYVIMPNHFHILVKEINEGGITSFMEKLTTGYSMYFNTRYKRSGALFQGRFKAEHVDRDEYLKYLYAYIHLNPVKLIDPSWKENGIKDADGARKYLENYLFSSFLDYNSSQNREESIILNKAEFPEYFTEPRDFKEYINDWLEFQPDARLAAADR
jgi:putative transposase